MTKNPFYNAITAIAYIMLVVLLINWGSKAMGSVDSILLPIGMLSLFVLSAALMGFIFFYQPAILIFEGKRPEAIRIILRTLGIFALMTALIFAASLALFS